MGISVFSALLSVESPASGGLIYCSAAIRVWWDALGVGMGFVVV